MAAAARMDWHLAVAAARMALRVDEQWRTREQEHQGRGGMLPPAAAAGDEASSLRALLTVAEAQAATLLLPAVMGEGPSAACSPTPPRWPSMVSTSADLWKVCC